MRVNRHRVFPGARLAFLLAASAVVLLWVLSALEAARSAGQRSGGPVYTVAALRAHLAEHPEAWVDRPLRVRALADICSDWYVWAAGVTICIATQPVLADLDGDGQPLPLAWGSAPPLAEVLRRLPLLKAVMPAPQEVRWDTHAVYRIRLREVPTPSCSHPPCYEAVLVDAAPDALGGG